MTRPVGYALILIGIATMTIWLISQFGQPNLPGSINSALVLFVAVLTGTAGFVAAFKDSIELFQMWTQARDRHFLNESLGRTVFDKATIARATRYYIRPRCSNLDPAQESEMRHALVATREDLFAKVDYFLDKDETHRHLLILADSGTGKTSFVLNYYAHNARRPMRKCHKLAIVPLGIKDADELLRQIVDPAETVVFLDALDEDTRAINDHRARIRELMDLCRGFKRVIITCRTQFFPKDDEIPVETGIARVGPRKAGERGAYEFVKLYLSPFDDDDVKRYIQKRYPFWARESRQKAYDLALKIPLLSVRPMLLAHIPDILASGKEVSRTYQLYEAMVDAWLERESSWTDKQALRKFSEHLAVDLYLNRVARGTERVPREELMALARAAGVQLELWQIGSRSLLNRDAGGNYKFAHRSIMEYLVALRLLQGDERCEGIVLTDQIRLSLLEMLWGDLSIFKRLSEIGFETLDWTARRRWPPQIGSVASCDRPEFFMKLIEILRLKPVEDSKGIVRKRYSRTSACYSARQALVSIEKKESEFFAHKKANTGVAIIVSDEFSFGGRVPGVATLCAVNEDRDMEVLACIDTQSDLSAFFVGEDLDRDPPHTRATFDGVEFGIGPLSDAATGWIGFTGVFPGLAAARSFDLASRLHSHHISLKIMEELPRSAHFQATEDDSPAFILHFQPRF